MIKMFEQNRSISIRKVARIDSSGDDLIVPKVTTCLQQKFKLQVLKLHNFNFCLKNLRCLFYDNYVTRIFEVKMRLVTRILEVPSYQF